MKLLFAATTSTVIRAPEFGQSQGSADALCARLGLASWCPTPGEGMVPSTPLGTSLGPFYREQQRHVVPPLSWQESSLLREGACPRAVQGADHVLLPLRLLVARQELEQKCQNAVRNQITESGCSHGISSCWLCSKALCKFCKKTCSQEVSISSWQP